MAKKYDLVIVGAGPCGLMAGRVASENGLKVAVLDRKTEIWRNRRFDGGVVGINEYTFGQLALFNPRDKRLSFPVGGFSVPYDGPYTNVFGFCINSPGGKKVRFGDWRDLSKDPEKNRVAIALNKEVLLKRMLEDCDKLGGVDIYNNTNVTDVKAGNGKVTVSGGGQEFEAPFVVAADGANARVARLMGFNKERAFFATSRHIGIEVEGVEYDELNGFNIVLSMEGYYSVLPMYKEGIYHISHLTHDWKVDLDKKVEWFMKESPVYSNWFKKARVIKEGNTSCIVNVYMALEDPFKDNVILASDATWIQEVSIPTAICFGWKVANAVTRALHDGKVNREGIQSYLDWYRTNCYEEYGKRKMIAIDLQKCLSAEDIDYMAELPLKEGKVFPGTMDFHLLFKLLGDTYLELFPRISEERPDIMEKMLAMRNEMDEAGEVRRKMGFATK